MDGNNICIFVLFILNINNIHMQHFANVCVFYSVVLIHIFVPARAVHVMITVTSEGSLEWL